MYLSCSKFVIIVEILFIFLSLVFSYPKIMKAVNYLSRPGVEFLVTNEDLSFPTQRKGVVVPGSGAMSVCIRAVSGREPIVFGKPAKVIFLAKW